MAALTTERRTLRYGQEPAPALWSIKVKAATKCYAGGIAVVDAGYAAPGRVATGLRALGRFEQTVDNSGGASGDVVVDILSGVFKWANSAAGDAITQADLFSLCYVVDDQTVAKTSASSTRSTAGIIVGVESDGVWVLMGWGAGRAT